jgi:hypothetical protein
MNALLGRPLRPLLGPAQWRDYDLFRLDCEPGG